MAITPWIGGDCLRRPITITIVYWYLNIVIISAKGFKDVIFFFLQDGQARGLPHQRTTETNSVPHRRQRKGKQSRGTAARRMEATAA